MAEILPDLLMERAELIAIACTPHLGDKPEWWGGYKQSEGLKVVQWDDTRIDYRRKKVGSATLMLTNIQSKGLTDIKESEPVELSSKVVDAASIESLNADGVSERHWEYSGTFDKTVTKRHAFETSFDQTITSTTTVGGEAASFKQELEVALGFSQTTSDEEEKAEQESRTFLFAGDTPAGVNERATAWRKVSKVKSIVTGNGDYEHSIKIGKHWHGSWQGDNAYFETFADFLRTIKGEAPSNWPLSKEFAKQPAPSWLIRKLSAPLDLPYRQPLEFDQATTVKLKSEAI